MPIMFRRLPGHQHISVYTFSSISTFTRRADIQHKLSLFVIFILCVCRHVHKKGVVLQNPSSNSPYPGNSPQVSPPAYAPMPDPRLQLAPNVSNGTAVLAMVMGLLTGCFGIPIMLIDLGVVTGTYLEYSTTTVTSPNLYNVSELLFAVGSFFALISIMSGHIGLRKSNYIGGHGSASSICGLVWGYAFFGIFFLMVLFGLLTSYHPPYR